MPRRLRVGGRQRQEEEALGSGVNWRKLSGRGVWRGIWGERGKGGWQCYKKEREDDVEGVWSGPLSSELMSAARDGRRTKASIRCSRTSWQNGCSQVSWSRLMTSQNAPVWGKYVQQLSSLLVLEIAAFSLHVFNQKARLNGGRNRASAPASAALFISSSGFMLNINCHQSDAARCGNYEPLY